MPKTPLAVVGRPSTVEPPPRPLKAAGIELWESIRGTYDISDSGGVELLMQACHTADRLAQIEAVIAEDGVAVRTKTGLKANPILRDEIQARAFICRTLERLGLNLESLKPVSDNRYKARG